MMINSHRTREHGRQEAEHVTVLCRDRGVGHMRVVHKASSLAPKPTSLVNTTSRTMTEASPSYEAAALEHGAVPLRDGPPAGKKQVPRGPFPLDIPVLNQLRGKRVILASQSPARRQILSKVNSLLPLSIQINNANFTICLIRSSQTWRSCPPRFLKTSPKKS